MLGRTNWERVATGSGGWERVRVGRRRPHPVSARVAHYLTAPRRAWRKLRSGARPPPTPGPRPPTAFPHSHPPAAALHDLLPDDHRHPYDMDAVLESLDGGGLSEFQPDHAAELICGTERCRGTPWPDREPARHGYRPARRPSPAGRHRLHRVGEKAAFFIDAMNRQGTPILFVQDVSGFMVGPEAEHNGIIRAGARFVEAMATAVVPKLVLTLNHASGAGYYAMAGQGFDPDFILTLPTGRMGVMEGASAVMALFGGELDRLRAAGEAPDAEMRAVMDEVRADYDRQLDATFAAAGGSGTRWCSRELRTGHLLLRAATQSGPTLGACCVHPGWTGRGP